MHEVTEPLAPDLPTAERYAELRARVLALVTGETDAVANLANVAAELFASVPDLNWAGFYLMKGGELVVGPFQGRPACVRIAVKSGSIASTPRASPARIRRRSGRSSKLGRLEHARQHVGGCRRPC
jgi:putative methionine-R-sulfoxide reductase with GAF domain